MMSRFFAILLLLTAVLMGSFGEVAVAARGSDTAMVSLCNFGASAAHDDQTSPDEDKDIPGSPISHGGHHHCAASLIDTPQPVLASLLPRSNLRAIRADTAPPSRPSDPPIQPPAA